jgi:mannose-6-phosphate isomerase-like protein (cupin superfamily)
MKVARAPEHAHFNPNKMGKVDLARGTMLSAGLNCFEAGQEHAAHVHEGQDKLYYVIEGEGILGIGDEETTFRTGDLAIAPSGVEHSLRNPGPGRLVVMVVFAPPPAEKKATSSTASV